MSRPTPPKILIIGAGIGGPPLATFLLSTSTPAPRKPHITILERGPSIRPQGQNIDIRGAGIPIIRKLGVERAIRAAVTGEEGVQLVDRYNRVWAAFAADRSGRYSTPTADIEILRGRLAEILYRSCVSLSDSVEKQGGKGVEFIFGDYLSQIEQDGDGVDVVFAKSGVRRRFDLVVGADGLQSLTRRMVWGDLGEKERVKRLGLYSAFFSLPSIQSDDKWRRWFHAPARSIMLRPSDRDDRTTALLFVIKDDDERLLKAAERRDAEGVMVQKRLMEEYFRGQGWECERILEQMMESKDFYYDMVAQVKMEKWSKGRVVLLADAGYCASPISGMGTTLALSGAYNLAGALTRHPNNYSVAFAEYEEKMRPVVDGAQKLVPGAPHVLNPSTEWGVWTLHTIMGILYWTGIFKLVLMFVGPSENLVTIEEYGFQQLPDLEESNASGRE